MLNSLPETGTAGVTPTPAYDPSIASPALLRMRYPAFADVSDAVIGYWLDDAAKIAVPAWGDDQVPATLALAAHNMARSGVPGLALGEVGKLAALGVTSFRSGSFSAQLSDTAVARYSGRGYASTTYGQDFMDIAQRHVATFGVTSPGSVVEGCGYRTSLLDGCPG